MHAKGRKHDAGRRAGSSSHFPTQSGSAGRTAREAILRLDGGRARGRGGVDLVARFQKFSVGFIADNGGNNGNKFTAGE